MEYKNQFLLGDTVETMSKIPAGAIDLIITSPPYNLRDKSINVLKGTSKWLSPALADGYDNHGDDMAHEDYVTWQRQCLTEMMRLIPDDGAIFYNHKYRIKNGLLQTHEDILNGFPVRQVIIWQRAGGFNFASTHFLPTYELVYLIAKPAFRLVDKANAVGDVWRINQCNGDNKHPAPFPEELATRIIKSTNAKIVLDCFGGSGTVALSAKKENRDFVYIDNSPTYVEMARKRLQDADVDQPTQVSDTTQQLSLELFRSAEDD